MLYAFNFRITGMNKFYILTRCIEIIYIYNWVWHQNDVKQSALNPSKNSHTTNHSFFLLVTEGQYMQYFAIFYTHMVRTILRTISRRISITHILGHRAWLLDGRGRSWLCSSIYHRNSGCNVSLDPMTDPHQTHARSHTRTD